MLRIYGFTVLLALIASTIAQYRVEQMAKLTEPLAEGSSEEQADASKNLDLLLTAAGISKCVRKCAKRFGEASYGFFQFNQTVEKLEGMCEAYKFATACIRKTNCEGSNMFAAATSGLDKLCVRDYVGFQIVKPCLELHADEVLKKCDQKCKFHQTVEALVNEEDVRELASDGGSDISLLEYLGPVCTKFACFLSCSHNGLNRNCFGTGYMFVEMSIKPIEDMVHSAQSGGLMEMLVGQVPNECRPLTDSYSLQALKYFGTNPMEKKPGEKPKKPADASS